VRDRRRARRIPAHLAPIEIPPGRFFLMGDNRGNCADSRYWGPVARDQIIGRAVATYWPLGRIGGARTSMNERRMDDG
jgi:signal peptidase I